MADAVWNTSVEQRIGIILFYLQTFSELANRSPKLLPVNQQPANRELQHTHRSETDSKASVAPIQCDLYILGSTQPHETTRLTE